MAKAVCLVSSGLDSVVTAFAIEKIYGYEPFYLHFQYGQRAHKKELDTFMKLVDVVKPSAGWKVVDISNVFEGISSALLDSSLDLHGFNEDGLPTSFVPFRNGIFLSVAASIAYNIGASAIAIGATQVDFRGYPDCTYYFIEKMEDVINCGLAKGYKFVSRGPRYESSFRLKRDSKNWISIITPILYLKKNQTVQLGAYLGVPFELTWSCYEDGDVACGECTSCLQRLQGFKEAGLQDPIPYKE